MSPSRHYALGHVSKPNLPSFRFLHAPWSTARHKRVRQLQPTKHVGSARDKHVGALQAVGKGESYSSRSPSGLWPRVPRARGGTRTAEGDAQSACVLRPRESFKGFSHAHTDARNTHRVCRQGCSGRGGYAGSAVCRGIRCAHSFSPPSAPSCGVRHRLLYGARTTHGWIHPRAIIVAHNPEWANLILEETCLLEGGGSLNITLLSRSDADGHARDEKADVLITTLSNLLRSLGNKRVSLHHVEFLLVHGLDWLLDGGYHDDIYALVHETESECQIVLLSAVLPRAVLDLETRLLQARNNNVRLIVGPAPGKPIPHVPMLVHHEEDRLRTLIDILPSSSALERVLILTNSPQCERHLLDKLASKHLQAAVLAKEADVWQDAEDSRILITNDYMLRGFKGIAWRIKPNHLINYELPDDVDYLVHRMGRVGMPFSVADDHSARITTFVTSVNARSTALPDLVELLLENQQEVPLWLKQLADAAPKPTYGSWW